MSESVWAYVNKKTSQLDDSENSTTGMILQGVKSLETNDTITDCTLKQVKAEQTGTQCSNSVKANSHKAKSAALSHCRHFQ